jgi:hypothetical protein
VGIGLACAPGTRRHAATAAPPSKRSEDVTSRMRTSIIPRVDDPFTRAWRPHGAEVSILHFTNDAHRGHAKEVSRADENCKARLAGRNKYFTDTGET